MSQLQNDINQVLSNVAGSNNSSATADWIPAVDEREYVNRFKLLVSLPGVALGDLEITRDTPVPTLAAERSATRSGVPACFLH